MYFSKLNNINMGIILGILALSIPIVAILSDMVVKINRMKLEKSGLNDEEKKLLKELLDENKDLRKRVESLELLVADNDTLRLNSIGKDMEYQKQIDYLAEEILKLKASNKNKQN
ncbi:MAG: hypothetical protein OHK0038_14580 [Flammeovirgaceae bacterium]